MGVSLSDLENAIGAIGRGGASSPVIIGSMVLTGPEVPDILVVGGQQTLVVHRMVGGGRTIDAMGNDPARLRLRGQFVGPTAQARAQLLERMRQTGGEILFSIAGMAFSVWIAEFSYVYQAKGAMCPYDLVLERGEDIPPVARSMTEQVQSDLSGGLAGVSDMLARYADGGFIMAGQIGTVVGQVMPLAQLVGAGGLLAKVQDAMSRTSTLTQTGSNLAASPGNLKTMIAGLADASSGLKQCLDMSGANMESVLLTDGGSLAVAVNNAELASMAADTGAVVDRGMRQASAALGGGGE